MKARLSNLCGRAVLLGLAIALIGLLVAKRPTYLIGLLVGLAALRALRWIGLWKVPPRWQDRIAAMIGGIVLVAMLGYFGWSVLTLLHYLTSSSAPWR